MPKPRLFIASSSESYDVASACNICLDRYVEVTIWDKIFEPGGTTLNSLLEKSHTMDFSLFIFSPDDITNMRSKVRPTVRDNVLFELGLFTGALGQKRCFILKPRDKELYMPTDLLGININDYNAEREDRDLNSAVNSACTQFLTQIKNLGKYQNRTPLSKSKKELLPKIEVTDDMIKIMADLLPSLIDGNILLTYKFQNGMPDYKFNLSLIKLERINLIEKAIDSDFDGNQWTGFRLTQNGADFLLENEEKVKDINEYADIPF